MESWNDDLKDRSKTASINTSLQYLQDAQSELRNAVSQIFKSNQSKIVKFTVKEVRGELKTDATSSVIYLSGFTVRSIESFQIRSLLNHSLNSTLSKQS